MSGKSGHRSSSNLQRGSACANCRRRKMRCDGNRPVCGQCTHSERPDDCEYIAGQERSTTQILEENICRLEARIQELQNPAQVNPPITLHQPYASGQPSYQGQQSRPACVNSACEMKEPSAPVIERLFASFFPFASEYGFFLNIPRFQALALSPAPFGHPSRPSPAVLSAVYLWGVHLSLDPTLKACEQQYLTNALQQASVALSGNHPSKVIHGLQAEILLAYFFFSSGRFLEGRYHVSAAVSIFVTAGLAKIRSAQSSHAPLTISLPVPRDAIEEGEHIHACWTVFNLDQNWSVALDQYPSIDFDTKTETQIDTPWPMEMSDYEQGRFPPNARTSQTLHKFLSGVFTSDIGLSSKAILSKASFLWSRSSFLVHTLNPHRSQEQRDSSLEVFSAVESAIEKLKASVPPLDQMLNTTNVTQVRNLIVGFSILHAAALRMHNIMARSSERSKRKRLCAAQSILDIACIARSRNLVHLNPIIGTTWIDASQVLINEISALRSKRASWPSSGPTEIEINLIHGFQRGLGAIDVFSSSCALTREFLPNDVNFNA